MINNMSDDKLLELLDMYMDMNETKDEIIDRMGQLLRKQAQELAHLKNMHRLESDQEK